MPCKKPLFEGQGWAVTLLKLVMGSFSLRAMEVKKVAATDRGPRLCHVLCARSSRGLGLGLDMGRRRGRNKEVG